jgi:hypothetical protein
MGARLGPSLQGVIDLMREISSVPTLENLSARYGG